ncbi:MAG: FeoA family protein [Planctomycetota bacterium]|nr:FeoA family protein [Planctomycetota bacterium]
MVESRICPLGRLGEGSFGTVVSLPANRHAQSRLKHMGLKVGDRVRVLRGGPGRWGPTLVASGNLRLAIGRGMAENVLVRPIGAEVEKPTP